MIEIHMIYLGVAAHFAILAVNDLKTRDFRQSKKIFFSFVSAYALLGIGLTIWNFNAIQNVDECGSEVFNPLIFVSLLMNVVNVLIFVMSCVLLRVLKLLYKE